MSAHRSSGNEVAELLAVRLVHHDVEVVVPGEEAAIVVEAHEAALEYGVPVVGRGGFAKRPEKGVVKFKN